MIELKLGSLYILVGGLVLRFHGPYGGKGPMLSFRTPSVDLEEGPHGASFSREEVTKELTADDLPWLLERLDALEERNLDVEAEEARLVILAMRMMLPEEEPRHVTPRCCATIQDYQAVVLSLADQPYDQERDAIDERSPVVWRTKAVNASEWAEAHTHPTTREAQEAGKQVRSDGFIVWTVPAFVVDPTPEPKFCPFCGTALPAPVRRKHPPRVHTTRDGTYCDTCGERNGECYCAWTTQLYEVPA